MSDYACLGHTFRVTADDPVQLGYVESALHNLRSDSEPTTHYHLADRHPEPSPYRLFVDGRLVWTSPHPGGTLDNLMWHLNDRVATDDRSRVLVHAGSLVAPDGGVLLLPALSGSGKTTTTLSLLRHGYGYLSDEFAVLDPGTGSAEGFPRPLSLKAGTQALFPDVAALSVAPYGNGVSAYVPAERVRAGSLAAGGQVRWVMFPRYDPTGPPSATPLRPSQVLVKLAENTFNLQHRYATALPVLRAVAEGATGWELRTGDLGATCRLVDALIAGASRHIADRT